jgi:hypothetical protein
MTMLAEVVDAVIGIDTHRDSHEVEIADAAGKPITTMRVSNDSGGFARLLAAIAEVVPGRRVAVSIEGTRGYGIGLARALAAAGQTVPHAHLHLIPRYTNDPPDPRGGVRWIFPDRAAYWSPPDRST